MVNYLRNSGGETIKPALTVGIPADRDISWTARLLSKLDSVDAQVEALVARSVDKTFDSAEMSALNDIFPTVQVSSQLSHAPAMRNAVIAASRARHILFLDDDMVPGENLLASALDLADQEPDVVHQGVPYRVANVYSWLARSEGKLYERGYKKYVEADGSVSMLDARLMLAPTEVLRDTPFNESLVLGAGEGRELAKDLIRKGVVLRLAKQLDAAHLNRDTLISLAKQKRAHGRSLGYLILSNGAGEDGWWRFYANYGKRHFIRPIVEAARGDMGIDEAIYAWGTNTVLWASAFEYMLRKAFEPEDGRSQP
jgi:hypothetical protein